MSDIHSLLIRAGLPAFPLDDERFPNPGSVVRYYREKMKYVDPTDGKEKYWTQADLAKRLGTSEVTVRLMETRNVGLDSITRRRLVADLLKIPPVLLGLGSLDELLGFLQNHEEHFATSSAQPLTQKVHIEKETISLYRDAAAIYNDMHLTGTAQESILEIEQWISRIKSDTKNANASQRQQLLDVLWEFYDLTAKIYSDDLRKWDSALAYLNAEMELATLLESDELRAASLYRAGQIHFAQRQYLLAKTDLDGAVLYVQSEKVQPSLKSAVFAATGLAYALVASDESDKTHAQSLLSSAEKIVVNGKNPLDDGRFVRFNLGKYFLEYADTLVALKRPKKALRVLDDADDNIDSSQKRRHAYINILRAEAYMNLQQPQLDIATDLLGEAFKVSQTIKSEFNISYITRLYGNLLKGPYGNSTNVADLGMGLRNWRKTQIV